MSKNPSEKDTAIPPGLLSAVTIGLYRFLSSEPKTINDNTRHTSAMKAPRECRPEQPLPEDSGSCINFHAYCTGRQDNSIEGIQLSRGPRDVWRSAVVEKRLVESLKYIKPLTQLTEAIFQGVLPEVFNKYKLVYNHLRSEGNFLGENVKSSFGIWTSRGAVLCAQTDVHVDLLDVPLGYCAIIPLGKFTGGHICLPSLGIKIELQPGKSYPTREVKYYKNSFDLLSLPAQDRFLMRYAYPVVSSQRFMSVFPLRSLSLGRSETVKFIARHTHPVLEDSQYYDLLEITVKFLGRTMDYRYIHFRTGAAGRAKIIDSCLTSEGKQMI